MKRPRTFGRAHGTRAAKQEQTRIDKSAPPKDPETRGPSGGPRRYSLRRPIVIDPQAPCDIIGFLLVRIDKRRAKAGSADAVWIEGRR